MLGGFHGKGLNLRYFSSAHVFLCLNKIKARQKLKSVSKSQETKINRYEKMRSTLLIPTCKVQENPVGPRVSQRGELALENRLFIFSHFLNYQGGLITSTDIKQRLLIISIIYHNVIARMAYNSYIIPAGAIIDGKGSCIQTTFSYRSEPSNKV